MGESFRFDMLTLSNTVIEMECVTLTVTTTVAVNRVLLRDDVTGTVSSLVNDVDRDIERSSVGLPVREFLAESELLFVND